MSGPACHKPPTRGGLSHGEWVRNYGAVMGVAAAAVAAIVAAAVLTPDPKPDTGVDTATLSASATTSRPTATEAAGKDLQGAVGLALPEQRVEQETLKLLATRSRAALARDQKAWMSILDPREPDLRKQQRLVFQNLARVPFATWNYYGTAASQVTAVNHPGAGQAYSVPVVFQYAFADRNGQILQGTAPVRRRVSVRVVHHKGTWRIVRFESGTATEPWDQGPVHVSRGRRSLLLSVGPKRDVQQIVRELDAAGDHVDRLWGRQWPRVSVAVLPQTQRGLAQLLGRPANSGLQQIAAMTSGEIQRPDTVPVGTSSDRVLLNPNGFPTLGALGRSVVLRHELTHVATRAVAQQNVPMWLSEGYADYVAYHGLSFDERKVAASAIARYGSQPTPQLPNRHEFDASLGQVAPAYGGAWLAVLALSRHGGSETVKAVYRRAAAVGATARVAEEPEGAADAAVADITGLTREDLVRAWQQEMRRVAAANYSR